MKTLLQLEYVGLLLLSIVIFSLSEFSWWFYPLLILVPDIGMIGYLISPKIGSITYNIFHHYFVAIVFVSAGLLLDSSLYTLIGSILLGHTSLDRLLGYGLKYPDSFKHTHLKNL